MQTKYDFRRKIIEDLIKNQDSSFSNLISKMEIKNYQERSNFLEVLQELQMEGIIYYNSKSKYKLFPKDTLQIDQIISVPDGFMLKNANVLVNNKMTHGKLFLDKDLVVTTKNIDEIYITKLIDRDIKSLKPYLLSILQEKNLTYKQIKRLAHIRSAKRKNELDELLDELKENGTIYQENNYYKLWPSNLSLARLDVDSNGYIFYELDGKRIYPDKDELNGAIQDDIVAITNRGKHIQKIINRKHSRLVFEVIDDNGIKSLAPVLINGKEDLKARISSIDMKNLSVGDRILVNLTNKQTDGVFEADYINTIGRIDDSDIDISSLATNYGFETDFSDEVMKEAHSLPQEVSDEEIKERYDFCKRFKTFTIDCDNTKDMDDAVSIMKTEDGNYILAVHIADVAHYVTRNSKLDQAAYERGLSVYPANTVIPQLPSIISNGICSLNPNEKRLTKSCIIEISQDGKILDYNFCNSVIKSHKKMKYSEVNQILDDNQIPQGYENFVDDLIIMKELSDILEENRTNEGKITFEEDEFKISEDEYGHVTSIDKKSNGTAGKIIENFMILYNYCQALYLNYTVGTAINRIHEIPDIQQIQDAREELNDLGYDIPPINTLDITNYLQKVLNSYKDTKDYNFISKTFLKSMPRAYYSPYQLGHFGLGLDYYSHSTSPIRRYPDLKAQQIIDSYQQGKFSEIESIDSLVSICDHCSYKEKQADLLEKKVALIKMMDYVDRHPQKTYYGIISNIRPERFEFETVTGIPGYVEYTSNDNIIYSKNKKQLKNKNGICLLKMGDLIHVEAIKSNRRELKMKANLLKNITLQEQNMKGATALKKTYVKK